MADPQGAPPGPATGEQPVTNGFLHSELVTWFRRSFGGSILTAIIAAGGTSLVAWRALAQEARTQADAGVLPVTLKVDDLERRVVRIESQTGEVQADIRALYKAVMTGRPQERLERPAPAHDGGP